MTQYFKALSDKTRQRIVNLLIHNELNVNEIVSLLGMGQPRVSRHLRILTECGIIKFRRDGLWVFYSGADKGEGKELIDSIGFLFNREESFKNDTKKLEKLRSNSLKETSLFFDSVAEDWEALKHNIIGDFDLSRIVLEKMINCSAAADLGCGTGDFLPVLKKRAEKVIGVDNSPNMLKTTRDRFAGQNGFDLRMGEMEHLPLRDGEADFALINMVLHHLSDPYSGLLEANRILNHGGMLVIADFDKHMDESMRKKYGDRWLGFEKKEVEKWLEKAGFKTEKSEENDLLKGKKLMIFYSKKI